MSTGPALALLGVLASGALGLHMLRPHPYLGKGTAPISDPRAIRWFGAFFLALAGAFAILTLYQFVSE